MFFPVSSFATYDSILSEASFCCLPMVLSIASSPGGFTQEEGRLFSLQSLCAHRSREQEPNHASTTTSTQESIHLCCASLRLTLHTSSKRSQLLCVFHQALAGRRRPAAASAPSPRLGPLRPPPPPARGRARRDRRRPAKFSLSLRERSPAPCAGISTTLDSS